MRFGSQPDSVGVDPTKSGRHCVPVEFWSTGSHPREATPHDHSHLREEFTFYYGKFYMLQEVSKTVGEPGNVSHPHFNEGRALLLPFWILTLIFWNVFRDERPQVNLGTA